MGSHFCNNFVHMETEIDEDWTSCISKGENGIKNSIYESQVKNSIVRDDEDKFISLLEKSLVINSRDMLKLKFGDFEVCPYKLLAFICRRRAVNCGTALVKGKTDLKLDLNIPIDQGVYLLHEAASSLSLRLVELFLHHGARANVQCSAIDSEHNGLLPLHVALERVRYDERLAQWTPRKSIFKLIIMLCLPKMKEALETNRLLLYNTYGFKEVVRYFVKGGKLIELAVLLMVAREIVMDPLDCQNITPFTRRMGCITLQQSIQLELTVLINYEYRLMYRNQEKKLYRICKKLKATMMYSLQILEIFERAGGAIEAYLQLDRTNVSCNDLFFMFLCWFMFAIWESWWCH
ncbi:uncharacterized protein LOC132284704 isoform X2 [Cornus florida]|uniref:uncharacterized protein LOC132284704 isoform X2 n=1 Tax=Cornus florida TaxID=4283 RepID=UPI00289DB7BF|nr:uncharacterized protein LOC132284704 isoform X2 [Cornus florida]